jgi:hypothetical protein
MLGGKRAASPRRLKCEGEMAVEALPKRFDDANVRGFPLKI